MLSDEEKKAINNLNFIIVTDIYDNEASIDKTKIINEYNESVGIVLNLIKKQFKEIEELKTINQMQKYRIEVIDERELISKDKLKEILGIEENIDNDKLLSLLQTIVDENVRLEDIEDRKIQIEYNNVFNKGVKSIEDKIKAKIEEVEQWELYNMKIPRLSTLDERLGAKIGIKYVLQSLLKKE